MANETKLKISPYCVLLRSKKLFFLESPPMTESDILDGSGHCWCELTMDAIGPGGVIVDPEDCQSRRKCYEPWGPRPSEA